jgi:peptidoglycan/LPS O-acetylase OafA/YrhL
MRLELVPLILGALLGLCGLAVVADGWLADPLRAGDERRRHARTDRHRGGEVAVGLGLVLAAAALVGRDTWRFGTVAVIGAAVLVVAGAALNARFLAERVANRGALRRGRLAERRRTGSAAPPADPAERRPHERRDAERRSDGRAAGGGTE